MTSSRTPSMFFEIDICNKHSENSVDISALRAAIQQTLQAEQVESAVLSVTIVSNDEMHELNRQHLQHDYPTDVISFQLDWSSADAEEPSLTATGRSVAANVEGEIIVSYDYAQQSAEEVGWSTENELTLYVVHGLLHICGYDDLTPAEKLVMRGREKAVLTQLGLSPIYPADDLTGSNAASSRGGSE